MREAIGGVFTLQIIIVFFVLVSCYMAFSVNYTKAFRVKNEILSIIQKNEGLGAGTTTDQSTSQAIKQIEAIVERYNYNLGSGYLDWCEKNGYQKQAIGTNSGFCYKTEQVDVSGGTNSESTYKGSYYTVATFVNIDLPLFNKFLPFVGNLFIVEGETSLIYSSGTNSEIE